MNQNKQNFFSRLLQDTGLRTKMIIIFFVLLILPFCLFTFYSTNRIKSIMKEQTFASARKTFDEASISLQTWLEKMNTVADILSYDELLYRMFSTDPDGYSVTQQMGDFYTMSTTFSQLQSLSGVDHIRLYLGDDYYFSNNGLNFFSFEGAKNSDWHKKLSAAPARHWFCPLDFADQRETEQPFFSFMRLLYNATDFTESAAVLRVDVSQEPFEQAINRTAVTENGRMLLITDNQVILSSSDADTDALPGGIAAALFDASENEWVSLTLGGEDNYVFCTSLGSTGWKLATVIPHADINYVSRDLSVEMILVMLVLAGIAYALALFLADFTLRRIWLLADTMQKVQNGDTDAQFPGTSKDEIGQLITHFNHMMLRIRQLMEEKVQYGLAIKNLELKALQAQINPHFLYNTLDTINCLAIQRDVPEISDVVSSLATFYKISLSKGRERIRIREEITHAQMYLQIQDARFHNQIQTVWDISPDIEDLQIIKIILQPIIENAAIHGIYERPDGTGTISVKGWRQDGDVYITVADDGIGMTADVIAANFSPSSSEIADVPGGYGIRNICDRLRIAYGPEYGLSCESTPGAGTVVTVHIPVCED